MALTYNTKKIKRLELLQDIIHDMITELNDPDMAGVLPNRTKTIGFVVVCQFRRRENPDQVETINIRYSEPVYLGGDGEISLSPAKENDFPDIVDFSIYPGA